MEKIPVKNSHPLTCLHNIDVLVFLWTMKRKRLAPMARFARCISHTADGFLYPVLALVLYRLDPSLGLPFTTALAVGFAFERPLYLILKNTLRRRRPPSALPGFKSHIIPSDQFSFPSGHTSGAFMVAVMLCLYFPLLGIPALIWATLVGAARVTLGVHFPTDIVAGATMGATLAWSATRLLAGSGWLA